MMSVSPFKNFGAAVAIGKGSSFIFLQLFPGCSNNEFIEIILFTGDLHNVFFTCIGGYIQFYDRFSQFGADFI